MTDETIKICGKSYNTNDEHFSFDWPFDKIEDMSELDKLKQFVNLTSASFGGTNINDLGLKYVCEVPTIENISLQDTRISNDGIAYLSQLKALKHLRLKENNQLNSTCVQHLNKLKNLINLQIHETKIGKNGIKLLDLPNLKDLLVNDIKQETLINLSSKLPECRILVKGKAEFLNGYIVWEK